MDSGGIAPTYADVWKFKIIFKNHSDGVKKISNCYALYNFLVDDLSRLDAELIHIKNVAKITDQLLVVLIVVSNTTDIPCI